MEKEKKKWTTFQSLKLANTIAFRSNKKLYISLILLSLFLCINTFVNLAFTEYAVNAAYYLIQKTSNFIEVVKNIILLTALVIFFQIMGLIRKLINNRFNLDIKYYFNNELNQKLGSIKWDYYENHDTFIKIHEVRQHTLETIQQMVNNIINYIIFIPTFTVYGYYLFQVDTRIVFVYFILVILFNFIIAGKMFAQLGLYWKETQFYTQRSNYFFNICGDKVTHQEYKKNRMFHYASDLWEKYFNEEYKLKLKIFKKHEITLQTARIIFNFPYIMMMILIAYGVMKGHYEIGFLIMSNTLLNKVINSCLDLQNSITNNRIGTGFIKTFQEVMQLEEETAEPTKQFDEIVMKDISFQYPQAERFALNHLNLRIKKGEKIAVVGKNGSGKTTFTNILMALTNNYSGKIINREGKEILNLRNKISCITQEFANYQMSIRDNITVGDPCHEFTNEEVLELLEKVGLKEYVLSLSDGINTILGQLEEGVELSKGQWQRLAVARLLAKKEAEIWILDEPTAYLDPISEIEMYDMVYSLAGDKTVIFISHRLGFAKRADRILVFENGHIAEEGSHGSLMKIGKIYYELYDTQKSWYAS